MKLRLISLAMLALLSFSSCKDKLTGPPATPATSDTIANWSFNGNTLDVTNNGHDGTPQGTIQYYFDRFYSYGRDSGDSRLSLFPSTGSFVSVPSTPDITFTGNDSYTISAWVEVYLSSRTVGIVCKGPQDGSYPGYQLGLKNGFPDFVVTSSTGSDEVMGSTPVPFTTGSDIVDAHDTNWHLVVASVTPGSISLYLDGALVGSKPVPVGSMIPDYHNTDHLLIGSDPTEQHTFVGLLDEILIYHHALDSSEVAARYHEGGWDGLDHTPISLNDSGWTKGNFGTSQSIEGICFPNGVGVEATGYACGLGGTLLKTIDSGHTWQAVTSNTTQDLYRVSFADMNTGLVGGNNGTILRTTDAGKTWASISAPFQTVNGGLENIRDLKFLDPTHAMIVGGAGNTQTGQADGFVMVSSDAGLTWSRTKTTNLPLFSIGESSEQLVTIVGSEGAILSTNVLGTTWIDESVNDNGDDFLAVDYSPIENITAGMAVTAYGTLYNTSNGGAGWGMPVNTPVSSSLRTVKSLNVGEWWIAGDNGVILHTLNDGVAWTRMDINGVSVQWNDIVVRDPHTLAFVGANGTLYWYAH